MSDLIPNQIYTVHKINERTFAIEEKTPLAQGLCYLVCGGEKALLIDSCFGFPGFAETVNSLTSLPITVALTHAHLDHIGGNHFFREIWLHEADKPIFEKHTNPDYILKLLGGDVPPETLAAVPKEMLHINTGGDYRYFGDSHTFHLGGRDIDVVPVPGHTPGSVCFLDRKERMLFSGDSVCEWGILLHIPGEGCPPSVFLESMERLWNMRGEFDSLWPGHHGFPVEPGYIEDYMSCARQIADGTAVFGVNQGRDCAEYGRVLITVPHEFAVKQAK